MIRFDKFDMWLMWLTWLIDNVMTDWMIGNEDTDDKEKQSERFNDSATQPVVCVC